MKKLAVVSALLVATLGFSQTPQDSTQVDILQQNSAQRILSNTIDKGITIGGYGQIDYNQLDGDQGENGKLDVHRMVLLFGYRFNDKVQFVTEIEMEHVKEIYVEQAFLSYSLTDNINLRGGLMLVPMGLINEYHEPTIFNGVERPGVDKSIVPTTWREVGVGVSGKLDNASLKYQAYIFNGFKSTTLSDDGMTVVGHLGGSNGLRGGRQKGAESTINSPTVSAKVDYYGIGGLRLGASAYLGDTQPEDDIEDVRGAKVMVKMFGGDARYTYKKLRARAQYIHTFIGGAEEYNTLTGSSLGSEMNGWYGELAYNILPASKDKKLFAFARYEEYDTHVMTEGFTANDSYDRNVLTTGFSFHIAPGAVVKADYQFLNSKVDDDATGALNLGLGVWF
jgi:hypothetical protein